MIVEMGGWFSDEIRKSISLEEKNIKNYNVPLLCTLFDSFCSRTDLLVKSTRGQKNNFFVNVKKLSNSLKHSNSPKHSRTHTHSK
jgi:hypothetical protein